jgi:hypothetical protein
MFQWIQGNETALWWVAAVSGLTLLVTLIVVPWFLVKVPPDYFARERRRQPLFDRAHVLYSLWGIARNVLGLVLVVAGIFMLVLPGQGVLAILVGIMLMNFPGKQKLERRLIRQRSVFRSINWLRRRMGRAPLVA